MGRERDRYRVRGRDSEECGEGEIEGGVDKKM